MSCHLGTRQGQRKHRASLICPKGLPSPSTFPPCLCLHAGPTRQLAAGCRDKQPPWSPSRAGAAVPCSGLNHTALGCIPAKIINPKSHHLHVNPQRAEVCDGFKGLYETKTSCCIFMLRITFLSAGKAAALGLCPQEPAGRPGKTLSVLPRDHREWGKSTVGANPW